MKTTADFINALKAKHGLKSNYAVAKFLNQTDTAIARWSNGKTTFSDESAIQIANLLDLDPAYVVACMHAERAKHTNEKKLWERIATTMTGMAAALAVIVFLPFIELEPGMMHTFDNNNVQNIHYAKYAMLIILSLIIAALYISRSYRNDPHPD